MGSFAWPLTLQRTARLLGESWHVEGFSRVLRNELFSQRRHDDFHYRDWLYSGVRKEVTING